MSPLKSKAQVRKWGELVKKGEIPEKTFKEALKSTPSVHRLPERVEPQTQGRFKSLKQLRRFAGNKK